ncbi:MAG: DUF3993 domain-containing protein [Bacillota bacterium]|nr:DUF3993 domain-containing protein [Bacillota bacterium]
MKKTLGLLLLFIFISVPLSPQAKTGLETKSEVFDFLKDAYKAQISLSERGRTKEEISSILNPYFTEDYKKAFWQANIHKADGKFLTYGTDFAQYYIPYYQFSDKTMVVIHPNEIYVFEYFPENLEGPVGYKSHYEGLYLIKVDDEWKIDQYLYNRIPRKIINEAIHFSEK